MLREFVLSSSFQVVSRASVLYYMWVKEWMPDSCVQIQTIEDYETFLSLNLFSKYFTITICSSLSNIQLTTLHLMDENVIHVSLLLSNSAWLHGLVDESQMRKNNKNILVVPELSSIKSSQGACAENVESLRPQMAPSVGLIS